MAGPMTVTDEMLESQLKGLYHDRTKAGAVATLLLLLQRAEPSAALLLAAHIGRLTQLLEGAGPDEPHDNGVRANAAGVLAACAALGDELHSAVDEHAASVLVQVLSTCAEASDASGSGGSAVAGEEGPGSEAGGGGGDASSSDSALAVNALSAAAQLAREPGRMLDGLRSPEGMSALLACAAPAGGRRPAVLEGALDALCAVASHDDSRDVLCAAGAVPVAAAAVAAGAEPGALVRALMLLGMLLPSSEAARAQLVEAGGGAAVVRLFLLARQDGDPDIKAISRDVLALLTRDASTRAGVEAAVRRAAEAVATTASGRAPTRAVA